MRLFASLLPLIVMAKFQCFKNFKLVEVTPITEEQVQFLRNLEMDGETSGSLSFMKSPGLVNEAVHLLVSPEKAEIFDRMLRSKFLKTKTINDDIQETLDNEELETVKQNEMHWRAYQPYDNIRVWLESLAKKYPNIVKIIKYGRSFENRDIFAAKLSFRRGRKAVLLEGGIHGNALISPATLTFILNEFLTSENQKVKFLANEYDWYFVPTMNPDSHEYARGCCMNRFWRKTRSYTSLTYFCRGVDADRNFKYEWQAPSTGSSCSDFYAGHQPFSESETRALARFLRQRAKRMFAYISFQHYGQNLMIPYGYTNQRLDNYEQMIMIAQKTAIALERRHGTKYRVGTVHDITGGACGTSADWAKGFLNLPVVLTYQMRPKNGVLLGPEAIIPNAEEVLDSLIVLFKEARKYGYGAVPNDTRDDLENISTE